MSFKLHFLCQSLSQTRCLARLLARRRFKGERLFLEGTVGSGKSEFSRAFIREAYEDDTMTVPSPTYLLQNIYDDMEGPEIHHYDLYRVSQKQLMALDLQKSFEESVTLMEWPDRLGSIKDTVSHLRIRFRLNEEINDESVRIMDGVLDENDEVRFVEMEAEGTDHGTVLRALLRDLKPLQETSEWIRLPNRCPIAQE